MNSVHQHQIENGPIRFATPIPSLCNQVKPATLGIVLVQTIIVHSIF